MFQTIKNWVLYSSANPQKVSLTLKASIPFLVLLGLGQYVNDAGNMIDAIVYMIVAVGQLLSGASLIHGIVRKIYLTATGQSA